MPVCQDILIFSPTCVIVTPSLRTVFPSVLFSGFSELVFGT